jgi:glycosyltransferase involved in cell wall biosynthesis
LAVVIPVRNEEGCLAPLVQGLLRRYDSSICRVIVVDDNSTDSTGSIADDLARRNPKTPPAWGAPCGKVSKLSLRR